MDPDEAAQGPEPDPEQDSQAAFASFMRVHYRYFIKAVMAETGAAIEDAEDAIEDVMADILSKRKWGTLTNPRAWIRTAVRHRYYDLRKARRRETLSPQPHIDGSEIDDAPNAWEEWQWATQMLNTLPPTQRSVFKLYLTDMDTSEIADFLGKTRDTIRQNLAHARKRLKANLGKDYRIDSPPSPAPADERKKFREQ